MRYFITGGTGFIGGGLVKALAETGHEVRVLIRRESDREKFRGLPVVLRLGEMSNSDFLRECLQGVEVVFHLAAVRGGFGVTEEEFFKVNVEMTQTLLEAAQEAKVRRFVYCSSVSVLGRLAEKEMDESWPYCPGNIYARTKVEGEKIVLSATSPDFSVTVVRPVLTYGAGDDWGAITKLISLIERKRYATVGNGENTIHLCYIDDMVQGLMKASQNGGNGAVYIISGEKASSINDLVRLIKAELRTNFPVFHIPLFFAYGCAGLLAWLTKHHWVRFGRKAPVVTYDSIDIMARDRSFTSAKAQAEIQYRPQVSCEEGIRRTVAWYLARRAAEAGSTQEARRDTKAV